MVVQSFHVSNLPSPAERLNGPVPSTLGYGLTLDLETAKSLKSWTNCDKSSGVSPLAFFVSKFAPLSRRALTISRWPLSWNKATDETFASADFYCEILTN